MAEHQATLAASTLSGRYTELPKIHELVSLGVRRELISTYSALTDYVNNQTGLCYPQMRTIAGVLGCSVRTIQRHLHELAGLGLIDFVQRLRDDSGRYRGYIYRILHSSRIAERRKQRRKEKEERERQKGVERAQRRQRRFSKKRATGHESPVREDSRTSRENNYPPNPPRENFKEGYEWFFGEKNPPPDTENQKNKTKTDFKKGYEWFFE